MCVYGGGLLRVGRHELLYDSVGHAVHIIVHFVKEVGSDSGDWHGWLGSHSGGIEANGLVGVSTGLDLALQAFMHLDK